MYYRMDGLGAEDVPEPMPPRDSSRDRRVVREDKPVPRRRRIGRPRGKLVTFGAGVVVGMVISLVLQRR